MKNVLFASLALLAFLTVSFARTSTSGAIVGTATDASGALIPKAEAQLVNSDTSVAVGYGSSSNVRRSCFKSEESRSVPESARSRGAL